MHTIRLTNRSAKHTQYNTTTERGKKNPRPLQSVLCTRKADYPLIYREIGHVLTRTIKNNNHYNANLDICGLK